MDQRDETFNGNSNHLYLGIALLDRSQRNLSAHLNQTLPPDSRSMPLHSAYGSKIFGFVCQRSSSVVFCMSFWLYSKPYCSKFYPVQNLYIILCWPWLSVLHLFQQRQPIKSEVLVILIKYLSAILDLLLLLLSSYSVCLTESSCFSHSSGPAKFTLSK